MLDIRFIRDNPERVRQAYGHRGAAVDLEGFLAADAERRRLLTEVEQLRHRRNVVSEAVGAKKGRGEDALAEVTEMREVGERIKKLDEEVGAVEGRLRDLLLTWPNLPHGSVPVGADSRQNAEVRRWGKPRDFSFPPRPHWELGEALGILDLTRAAKIAQARFPLFRGQGALLERALINFMLDVHTREHGYEEVCPPLLVNPDTMLGTGQLPKFSEDLFKMSEDDLYLIPTAEVPLTNLFREEVLPPGSLPRRYVAFTPCFRREAGAAGKDTRGIIRQHQFDKVEMVKFAEAERSYDELEGMVGDAEEILRRLGLPHRAVLLCTGDMGFSAAKTYDIEAWFPAQGTYREISSCSNCEEFQARRAGIRWRPAPKAPLAFAHTLNGSGVAVGRCWAAILENYQEEDGTVTVPEALRPYMGGLERIIGR